MIQDVVKGSTKESAGPAQTKIEPKEVLDPLILAWKELERNMNHYKLLQCIYMETDDFCGYWLLEDLPRHGKQLSQKDLENFFKKVISDDGKTKAWAFKPMVGICSSCPNFTDGNINESSQFLQVRGRPRRIMPIYFP
jgi:hypothetical protein